MKYVALLRRALLRASASARVLVLAAVAVTVVACHDLITSAARGVPKGALRSINPPGTVIVTAANMRGWIFYDDQHDSTCTVATRCAMVLGPATPPAGAGSAELAVGSTSEGSALLIADYAGTRLDQITALSYSTFRQSADPGNNLAISLQFNVDYDLTDAANGYQGRLVFEPYQTNSGNVTQSTWQNWDARAGKWWGTRASVSKGGVSVANPCVQATPCTWSQLLAAFPDIGIHATYGAIVLKAGSGWASFRGNVDELTIAINGATTTFDFEVTEVAAVAHLHAEVEPGVVTGVRLPVDSNYAIGATVSYDFSTAPGYDSLLVFVDDSAAAPHGQIVMNSGHTIAVGATPRTTIDGQTSSISSRIRNFMTASDKVDAYYSLFDWLLDQAAVTDPDTLKAHIKLAQYITIDVVRDSATLRAVDDALATSAYYVGSNGDGTYYTWWDLPVPPMSAMSASASRAVNHARPALGKRRIPARAKLHRMPRASARAAVSRVPSPRASAALSMLASPGQPLESTLITYVNGINTVYDDGQGGGAYGTYLAIVALANEIPRFTNNDWVTFGVFYNRTSSTQIADHQATRLYCAQRGLGQEDHRSRLAILWDYARCTGMGWLEEAVNNDYSEAIRQWVSLKLNLPFYEEDAVRLATYVANNRWQHELFIAHSQGNMMVAQALRITRDNEGHPLESDESCLAVVALASPINPGDYSVDRNHVAGFGVRGDFVPIVGSSTFGTIDTPLSHWVDDSVSRSSDTATTRVKLGFNKLHSVDSSYLGQAVTYQAVKDSLTKIHKECVVGSVVVTPSSPTVLMGDSAALSVTAFNENGRQLSGRATGLQTQAPWATLSGSYFQALHPREDTAVAVIGLVDATTIVGHASVTIPLGDMIVTAHENHASYWTVTHTENWDSSVNPQFPAPPSWDGTPGDCSRTATVSDGKIGTTYLVQRCSRTLDLPYEDRPTESFSIPDPRYASKAVGYKVHDFQYQTGALLDARTCGVKDFDDDGHYCWDRITAHAYDSAGFAIARGKTCTVGCVDGGTYARRTLPGVLAPSKLPASIRSKPPKPKQPNETTPPGRRKGQ